jgi:hypothetical protein
MVIVKDGKWPKDFYCSHADGYHVGKGLDEEALYRNAIV